MGSVSGCKVKTLLIIVVSYRLSFRICLFSLRALSDLTGEAGDGPDAPGGVLLRPEGGEPAF